MSTNIHRLGRERSRRPRRLQLERLEARQLLAVDFGYFNDDSYLDMVTGIPGENLSGAIDAGGVSVIYGDADGLTTNDQFWSQDESGIAGKAESGDRFGEAVAVGDFNGDGIDDVAIGVPGEDVGPITDAGAINVIYGWHDGLLGGHWDNQLITLDTPGLEGRAQAYDRFGEVLAVGDFDNDGIDDLAVGVPHRDVDGNYDAGAVYILPGTEHGLATVGHQLFDQNGEDYAVDPATGDIIQTYKIADQAESYDYYGAALAVGDFNGGGLPDLAVGVPGEDYGDDFGDVIDSGGVNIIYSNDAGLAIKYDRWYDQSSPDVPGISMPFSGFGSSLAAGDFDNDDAFDLAVGIPGETYQGEIHAGAVAVLYGDFGEYDLDESRHQIWFQPDLEGLGEAHDRFGSSLAAADFDGDNRDDLAIGVPGESVGNIHRAGAFNVVFGSGDGLQATNNLIYEQNVAGVGSSAEAGDGFGAQLAAGFDEVLGRADLAVSVPGENDHGAVHVFYSKDSKGFDLDRDKMWHQQVDGIKRQGVAGDEFGGSLPASMLAPAPMLHNNPSATYTLFLDFDGGTSQHTNLEDIDPDDPEMLVTPPFNLGLLDFRLDGDQILNWVEPNYSYNDNSVLFDRTERDMIVDAWRHVAEDFASFDINVTTEYLGGDDVFRVLIGGDGTERFTDPTSGIAPALFANNPADNDVFTFSKNIQQRKGVDDLSSQIGTTASHEAGHGFGLSHKSEKFYPGLFDDIDEYSEGEDHWTPIMGANLSTDRTIWTDSFVSHDEPFTATVGSHDLLVLDEQIGTRDDDFAIGEELGELTSDKTLYASGIIEVAGDWIDDEGFLPDVDYFEEFVPDEDYFEFFLTSTSWVNIDLQVEQVGPNLDSTLRLTKNFGIFQGESAPDDDLNASLMMELGPGIYSVVVGSENAFKGDTGQYTLRVNVVPTLQMFYDPTNDLHGEQMPTWGVEIVLIEPELATKYLGPGSNSSGAAADLKFVDLIGQTEGGGPQLQFFGLASSDPQRDSRRLLRDVDRAASDAIDRLAFDGYLGSELNESMEDFLDELVAMIRPDSR